jgi:putative sterol carrier protein
MHIIADKITLWFQKIDDGRRNFFRKMELEKISSIFQFYSIRKRIVSIFSKKKNPRKEKINKNYFYKSLNLNIWPFFLEGSLSRTIKLLFFADF